MANYLEWTHKRIKGIVDFYGHEFMRHKKVLDVGCGNCDIGGALSRLGANVTALDIKQDSLKTVSKKYPSIKTVKADLDISWPFHATNFDLILSLGVLCHLRNFEAHIRDMCQSCNYLVIETAVCDSDDPNRCVAVPENKGAESANGLGCRPSAAAIEKVLAENGMNFKRMDSSRYNAGGYSYDWIVKNSGDTGITRRRIWFAVKNTSLVQFAAERPITNIQPSPVIAGMIPVLKDTRISLKASPRTPVVAVAGPALNSPNKILKVALCISGHLRTFEHNFQSVKDCILTKYDCDVFVHTWDHLGMSYRHHDAKLYMQETEKYLNKINSLYNPKKIIIESQKDFKVSQLMLQKAEHGRDTVGVASMYYKIEACNNLKKQYEKENNFTYDCVIRFRGDLHLDQPLPLDRYTDLRYLYVPLHGNFSGVNDQLAFGNSEIMDQYSSCYSNIENLLKNGAWMNPEKVLQFHVENAKIPMLKTYMRYTIRRANGLVQDNMILERVLGFAR